VNFSLWWSRLPWLHKHFTTWPNQRESPNLALSPLLAESIAASAHHIDVIPEWDLPNELSTWTRLQRLTTYIFRFVKNIRNRLNSLPPALDCLKANEKRSWLAYVQNQFFLFELYVLKRGASLARTSRLHSLNPFPGEVNTPQRAAHYCLPVVLGVSSNNTHRSLSRAINYPSRAQGRSSRRDSVNVANSTSMILDYFRTQSSQKAYSQLCNMCAVPSQHRCAANGQSASSYTIRPVHPHRR